MIAARTYRRTAGTRILAAAGLAILTGSTIAAGSRTGVTLSFFVLAALSLIAAMNAATAFGDRVTLDDQGIAIANAWLARVGRRPRRVAWEDILSLREHRGLRPGGADIAPRAIFLEVRSGRRLVIDSLQDFDAVVRTVRDRLSTPPACRPR